MKVKLAMMVGIAVGILMFAGGLARAQSDVPRFEVGAQYSLLNFDTSASFSKPRRWESGGGGRFTFNFNKYVAAEAQIDYFPNEDSERIGTGTISVPLWGSKTLTLFGVKAGTRRDRFGIFAKARPGFIHFSHVPGFVCISAPCLQPPKTNFAFDVGGVFEYYPSRRLVVRFDAGDTIIYHKRFFGTTNQFQTSAGVGVRF